MNEAALTPDRILEAAEDVLRRFGPSKANVVDVARALGVSHGSVYRHFPSKAALRDAVTERWLERVSRPLESIVAEDAPAPQRLYRWCKALMKVKRAKALDDPELFATYMTLAADSREVVISHVEKLISQVAAIIADGIERHEFSVDDPQAVAQAVLDATSRFHHPAFAASWAEPGIDDAFEALWSLILPGLVGRRRLSAASE
jgi:AcrR family transcriptional regulator